MFSVRVTELFETRGSFFFGQRRLKQCFLAKISFFEQKKEKKCQNCYPIPGWGKIPKKRKDYYKNGDEGQDNEGFYDVELAEKTVNVATLDS